MFMYVVNAAGSSLLGEGLCGSEVQRIPKWARAAEMPLSSTEVVM